MADPVQVIVHTGNKGLGPAVDFYKQFPWEPSPAGEMTIDPKNITSLQDATLQGVLDAMAQAPAGGNVLLVCHAEKNGLLMPVAKGAIGSAGQTELAKLLELSALQQKVKRIHAMPNGTDEEKKAKVNAWFELHRGIDSEPAFEGATLQQLEQNYVKWLEDVAQDELFLRGKSPRADLVKLIQSMETVQSRRFKRVELRACDIGGSTTAMETLKKFFGCQKLLAPTVTTFYLKALPIHNLGTFSNRYHQDHKTGNYRSPGPIGTKYKDPGDYVIDVVRPNPGNRIFWDVEYGYIPPENAGPGPLKNDGGTTTIKLKRRLASMLVEEVQKYWFRGSLGIWNTQGLTDQAQKFVKDFIMPASKYTGGDLNIAGFWTPGSTNLPWILPNDPEYIDQIKEV